MLYRIMTVVLALVLASVCDASDRRGRRSVPNGTIVLPGEAPAPYTGKDTECKDALEEVNAARAKRGLKPYANDPLLAKAAYAAAKARAAVLCAGHTQNDFGYVPAGGKATTAGCAAWKPDWGFGACALYDNYTYAGAAWVMGSDGRRYMHVFYR